MSIISKKVRYALHGLSYIAVHSNGRSVPLEEVLGYLRAYSQHSTLSPGYIAKIFQELSRGRVTEATPGPRGGYQLARPASEIHLIDVFEALEGPRVSECCLLSVGSCPEQETCGVRDIVQQAEFAFFRYLEQESLASLSKKMKFPDPETIRAHQRG